MEKIELSNRLEEVAKFVKIDQTVLDIGSDHAYLPIYLVKQKKVPAAIAGEVVQQPYENAQQQVAFHGLVNQISVRFGNGFDVLEVGEEVGSAVICGMGGALIADIIKKGLKDNKIGKETRLILQPNNNQPALRKLLLEKQFKIENEVIIKENRKFNEIIVATRSDKKITYNTDDLIFGPVLAAEKSVEFLEKWQKKYNHNQMIAKKLDPKKHQDKIKELAKESKQIRKVIE